VKFGAGAFMKTRPEAEMLAGVMLKVGSSMGVTMSHVLSPMDEPLGCSVGNGLEVDECVVILQGRGAKDVIELVLELASKVANSPREKLAGWLNDGTAWKKFVALVEAQDGDAGALERISQIHRAPILREIVAERAGKILEMDAEKIGRAALLLGGGRSKSDETIDFAVGISELKKTGEAIEKDEPSMRVHARDDESLNEALPLLQAAPVIE
jgi:pyrimidine-nucleoside phosphorylase